MMLPPLTGFFSSLFARNKKNRLEKAGFTGETFFSSRQPGYLKLLEIRSVAFRPILTDGLAFSVR
jgi:hypothetical protein